MAWVTSKGFPQWTVDFSLTYQVTRLFVELGFHRTAELI